MARKFLIIGSVALKHWFPDFKRTPGDIDIISRTKIHNSSPSELLVESHWFDLAEEILNKNTDDVFADPEVLLALKISHAQWNVNWQKTMFDICFLTDKGVRPAEWMLNPLIKHWEVIHGKKHVNLMVKNEDFFTKLVPRTFEHDYVHECAAFNDEPMYKRLKKDQSMAWVCKDLWDQLSFEDKCKTCIEEIAVIAIERSKLHDYSSGIDIKRAVDHSIKQLVTTMTSGWFPLFIITNYKHLRYDLYHLIEKQVKQAIKKLYKKEELV